MLNNGFAQEFVKQLNPEPPVKMGRVWVLPYRPERFQELAKTSVSNTANLTARWSTTVDVVTMTGDQITAVNGIATRAVIDCSGTAEAGRAAGIDCFETTAETQAPAIIFPLCEVDRDLSTPAAVTKVLLPLARVGLPSVVFQPGPDRGIITVKFAGTAAQVPELLDFLKKNVAGFEKCFTPVSNFTVSHRAGQMIPGQYVLSGDDVLQARKFPDAVARGAWPVEQWDLQGRVSLRYLPEGTFYEIPARSLRSAAIKNLFMAGKTISADVDAIASARVIGCCLATGAAAGNLAAQWLKSAAPQ
jgi:hypothetical protein